MGKFRWWSSTCLRCSSSRMPGKAKLVEADKVTWLDTDMLVRKTFPRGIQRKFAFRVCALKSKNQMTLMGKHKWQDQAGGENRKRAAFFHNEFEVNFEFWVGETQSTLLENNVSYYSCTFRLRIFWFWNNRSL